MANGGKLHAVSDGEIRVRIDAVERDVGHVEQQINAIRDGMATKADIQAIFARIEGLSTQYSALSKPNYSLMVSIVGVSMVFLTMLGGFAYWPISTVNSDLKVAISSLADKVVPQKQYEADQALIRASFLVFRNDLNLTIQQQRYNTDMTRLNSDISSRASTRYLEDVAKRVDRLEAIEMKK